MCKKHYPILLYKNLHAFSLSYILIIFERLSYVALCLYLYASDIGAIDFSTGYMLSLHRLIQNLKNGENLILNFYNYYESEINNNEYVLTYCFKVFT